MGRRTHISEEFDVTESYLPEIVDKPMGFSVCHLLKLITGAVHLASSDNDSLFERVKRSVKHKLDPEFGDTKTKRSTKSMLISKIAIRHVNLLWGFLLFRNPDSADLNSKAEAVRTLDVVGKELRSLENLGVMAPSWLKSIPMLALSIMRTVTVHVGVQFKLRKSARKSIVYEKFYAESCEGDTPHHIKRVVEFLKQSLVQNRSNVIGEHAQDLEGTTYSDDVLQLLDICERTLVALNDVLPIVTVFSKVRLEDVEEGWKEESGSDAGWYWEEPSSSVFHDLADNTTATKKNKDLEPVYSLMKKLLDYSVPGSEASQEERWQYSSAVNSVRAIASTYHLLRSVAKSDGSTRVMAFHAYKSDEFQWPQVRNVQFQVFVLEVWKTLAVSSASLIEEIVAAHHVADPTPEQTFCQAANLTLGCQDCLNPLFFASFFLCCLVAKQGKLFHSGNVKFLGHYLKEVGEAQDQGLEVGDSEPLAVSVERSEPTQENARRSNRTTPRRSEENGDARVATGDPPRSSARLRKRNRHQE